MTNILLKNLLQIPGIDLLNWKIEIKQILHPKIKQILKLKIKQEQDWWKKKLTPIYIHYQNEIFCQWKIICRSEGSRFIKCGPCHCKENKQ